MGARLRDSCHLATTNDGGQTHDRNQLRHPGQAPEVGITFFAALLVVGEASRSVVAEAKAAGVWIFGGGLQRQQASIVATDGTVADSPFPETKAVVGGFSILEVPTREEALRWAAKLAEACRCAQEVREIMYDPES